MSSIRLRGRQGNAPCRATHRCEIWESTADLVLVLNAVCEFGFALDVVVVRGLHFAGVGLYAISSETCEGEQGVIPATNHSFAGGQCATPGPSATLGFPLLPPLPSYFAQMMMRLHTEEGRIPAAQSCSPSLLLFCESDGLCFRPLRSKRFCDLSARCVSPSYHTITRKRDPC
eukprot:2447295-Rhodomonas_salina.4